MENNVYNEPKKKKKEGKIINARIEKREIIKFPPHLHSY